MQTRLSLRTLLSVCFIAALVAVAAGCSSGEELVSSSTTVAPEDAETLTISMVDNEFEPASAEVSVGTQITFDNDGDNDHNAVADDNSFKTADLESDKSETVTVEAPRTGDTLSYVCTLHDGMTGELTIVD